MEEEIKMMDPPTEWGYYTEDIHVMKPQYVYGRDMKDYVTNSVYDDWCKWHFPKGIKKKIKDDQLYLVWYHYHDASDPMDSSCSYTVYYIEKVTKAVQDMFEAHKLFEEELKKYQNKYMNNYYG